MYQPGPWHLYCAHSHRALYKAVYSGLYEALHIGAPKYRGLDMRPLCIAPKYIRPLFLGSLFYIYIYIYIVLQVLQVLQVYMYIQVLQV